MAEGVMLHLIKEKGLEAHFNVDSAGTYGGHAGELPDSRMRQHAARRGYTLTHRSRSVVTDDFDAFDLIVAMDDSNRSNLLRLAPTLEAEAKVVRMVDFLTHHKADHIPDPYYGGAEGFIHVIDLLEDACEGLLNTLTQT